MKGRGRGKESCDAAVKSTGSGKACPKGAADSAEVGSGGQGTDRACDDVHDVGETLSPSVAAAAPRLGVEVRFFDRQGGGFERQMLIFGVEPNRGTRRWLSCRSVPTFLETN